MNYQIQVSLLRVGNRLVPSIFETIGCKAPDNIYRAYIYKRLYKTQHISLRYLYSDKTSTLIWPVNNALEHGQDKIDRQGFHTLKNCGGL